MLTHLKSYKAFNFNLKFKTDDRVWTNMPVSIESESSWEKKKDISFAVWHIYYTEKTLLGYKVSDIYDFTIRHLDFKCSWLAILTFHFILQEAKCIQVSYLKAVKSRKDFSNLKVRLA